MRYWVGYRSVLAIVLISCSTGKQGPASTEPEQAGPATRPSYFTDSIGAMRWDCDHGDGQACTWLGRSYEEGHEVGNDVKFVPQSYSWAHTYYDRACKASHMEGCYRLGLVLSKGLSGHPDPIRADDLFKEACQRRYEKACRASRGEETEPVSVEELNRRLEERRAQQARVDAQVAQARAVAAQQQRLAATRAEAAKWAAVELGTEWWCYEVGASQYEVGGDRNSSCYRTKESCQDRRQSWIKNITNAKGKTSKSKPSACHRRGRAACFVAFWRLTNSYGPFCLMDFEDCEGMRRVAAVSEDISEVTECRAF